MEFIGEANEEINNVRSIGECRNLCLASTVYQCRSATYDRYLINLVRYLNKLIFKLINPKFTFDSNAKICRLTEETRRSAPSDFRPAERGVDYIENECADSKYIKLISYWNAQKIKSPIRLGFDGLEFLPDLELF